MADNSTHLPAPFTPPECDLRGMPYMPVDVGRLFDSELWIKSTGDEFKAAFALWGKAFTQIPAGSLPDDDELLAHLSGTYHKWPKVKARALHGWVKCSDGRLYHRTLSEKVAEAWQARLARIKRTEAARQAKADKQNQAPSGNGGSVTEIVTESATDDATKNAAENVTGSKGREGKGREEKERKEEAELRSDAPGASAPLPTARAMLWKDGVPIVRNLMGIPDKAARSVIGKLLRDVRDDCSLALTILHEAADLHPANLPSWLKGAANAHTMPKMRNGFMQMIVDEGFPSMLPAPEPADPVTAFLENYHVTH